MGQGSFNKFGTENHGFKATTLAPVNQRFVSSRLGLHAKQCQFYINVFARLLYPEGPGIKQSYRDDAARRE